MHRKLKWERMGETKTKQQQVDAEQKTFLANSSHQSSSSLRYVSMLAQIFEVKSRSAQTLRGTIRKS